MMNPPTGTRKDRIDRTNFDAWLVTATTCKNLVFQVRIFVVPFVYLRD